LCRANVRESGLSCHSAPLADEDLADAGATAHPRSGSGLQIIRDKIDAVAPPRPREKIDFDVDLGKAAGTDRYRTQNAGRFLVLLDKNTDDVPPPTRRKILIKNRSPDDPRFSWLCTLKLESVTLSTIWPG